MTGHRPPSPALRSTFLWIAGIVYMGFFANAQNALPGPEQVLRNIPDILSLPEEEKALGLPVELTVVVLHYDPIWHLLWVEQDDVIAYVAPDRLHADLRVGDLIEMSTKTTNTEGSIDGDFNYKLIERDKLPLPQQVSRDNLATLADQSAWVKARMTVTGYRSSGDHAILTGRIGNAEGSCFVITNNPDAFLEFNEAEIEIEGLMFKGDDKAFTLMSADPGRLRIVHPDLLHLFSDQITEVVELHQDSPHGQRVTLAGSLRRIVPGTSLEFEDDTGIVTVPIWQLRNPPTGTQIMVSGIPSMREGRLTLDEAVFVEREESPKEISDDYLKTVIRRIDHVRNLSQEELTEVVDVLLTGILTFRGERRLFM